MSAAWSVEDVATWVARLPVEGAEAIAQSFREEEICGDALLSYATRDRDCLKKDFGLSIGKATKLWKAIVAASSGGMEAPALSTPGGGGGGTMRSAEEGVPPELSGGASRTPSTTSPVTSRSLRLEPESARSTASPRRVGASPTVSEGELSAMKIKALKQHARAAGVSEEQLDDAEDEEDHKGAVIKLILATAGDSDRGAALRAELATMKIMKLIKRARAAGVSEEELEAAEAAEDHKGAVVELILEKEVGRPSDAGLQAATLRSELSSMTITKLTKRAAAAGVSEAQLEAAEDEDDDTGAVIELIVRTELASVVLSSEPPRKTQLAKQLAGMKTTALRKRALSAGADSSTVDEAVDADDPADALIALILLAEAQPLAEDAGTARLRKELHELKPGVLSKRARGEGVQADAIEAAMDSDDQKAALIELILGCISPTEPQAAEVSHGTLQSELSSLRLKELRARAKTEGVEAGLLEDAMDDDDPKGAVVQLLLDIESAAERARKDLEGMRLKELRTRAKEAGHSAELLEEAMDNDEPKAAVIELLLSPAPRTIQQPEEPQRQPEPEPEPEPAPLSASKAADQSEHPVYRALEAHQLEAHFAKLLEMGVKRVEDLEQLSQADVNELEMKKFDRTKFVSAFLTETPHHGGLSGKDAMAITASGGFSFEGGKHAMISYQWDNQREVTSVREHFSALGIPTWMDVDGGMNVDIFDSMAQGVSNAAVVVAFISQRYQDSENCKLELKYAKQRKVPIVPVLMQGGGWCASEWLGIITAGSLWTPLHEESTKQQNLQAVVDQIKATVPTTPLAAATSGSAMSPRKAVLSSGESEEVSTLRSELDRLRQDLDKAATQRIAAVDKPTADADSASNVLAPIPGEVPALSLNCRPTPDMEKLKSMLISADSDDSTMAVTATKSKIGALGMGGIGKTVTAIWLARHEDIRRHFELVVWVTLGQTPDLNRMQALIHLQVTGGELAADTTPEQAKEKITVAMRGRTVLLILDDIWEEEHATALDFVDTSTASKTLVTTRIRGLGGAAQVELGVPSEEESVKLLLASAGLARLAVPPAEASEVVQICGRLPLAIDLAGKMLRDLGVSGGDWAGIPQLLKQEMHSSADDDETTVEYRVIAASLAAIPKRDRENAKKVFSVFALVAEDTHVPLSAFRILLSAVTGESELVPELQLRKWMQVLINRSICLGTWEKPQLHDIVREYAIQLFSPEELQELQRKAVDAFSANRPVCTDPAMCGLRIWEAQGGNDCTMYVKREIEQHIRSGLDLSAEVLPPCINEWICHYPFKHGDAQPDHLLTALYRVLGTERLEKMVGPALEAGDDWLVVSISNGWLHEKDRVYGTWCRTELGVGTSEFFEGKCADWLARTMPSTRRLTLSDRPPPRLMSEAFEHWAVGRTFGFHDLASLSEELFFKGYGSSVTPEDLHAWRERLAHLLETTEAGRAHPMDPAGLQAELEQQQLQDAGDLDALQPLQLKRWQEGLDALLKADEPDHAKLLKMMHVIDAWGILAWMRLAGWDWALVDRIDTLNVLRSYNFDEDALNTNQCDAMMETTPLLPTLRGDIGTANAGFDVSLDAVRRHVAVQDGVHSVHVNWRIGLACGWFCLPFALMQLGRHGEAAKVMTDAGITWQTADARADAQAVADIGLRERGSTAQGNPAPMWCAEDLSWTLKLQYVLCTTWREVPVADVIAALPSPDLLASWQIVSSHPYWQNLRLRSGSNNVVLLAALVCEKVERPADALLYLEKALRVGENDPTTDMRPTTHAIGHALRGRMLAAQGKKVEAEAAFEQAVEVSHRTGLRLLEMFALRDLKKCILDGDGRGEEGTKRLKAVLVEMKGLPAELTKLLGGGLSAEEILRS
eukprot:COSAG06_NODE_2708_length_6408_cov_2.142970_1_plen_1860_part_00